MKETKDAIAVRASEISFSWQPPSLEASLLLLLSLLLLILLLLLLLLLVSALAEPSQEKISIEVLLLFRALPSSSEAFPGRSNRGIPNRLANTGTAQHMVGGYMSLATTMRDDVRAASFVDVVVGAAFAVVVSSQ